MCEFLVDRALQGNGPLHLDYQFVPYGCLRHFLISIFTFMGSVVMTLLSFPTLVIP